MELHDIMSTDPDDVRNVPGKSRGSFTTSNLQNDGDCIVYFGPNEEWARGLDDDYFTNVYERAWKAFQDYGDSQ